MTVQNLSIAATADDGHASSAGGLGNNTTLIDCGLSSGQERWIFCRFATTAAIAQASVFGASGALLGLYGFETNSATTWEVDWQIELTSNATAPASFADLSGRSYTSAVRYTNTAITGGVRTQFDVTTPMQALINSTAIANGAYILVVGKFVTGTTQRRRFVSWDNGDTNTDPEFALTYTDPPAGNRRRRSIICGAFR